MSLDETKRWRSFGGDTIVFEHDASSTGTRMAFAVHVPPPTDTPPPVLVFLSGLTCTWENVCTKGGIQRAAAEHGIAVVMPDTSPRGVNVADADRYDLGQGAGFYVDATETPWAPNYRMYTYVTADLFAVLGSAPVALDLSRVGIAGHSMGGHGALVCGLRNPDRFASISAFAPIASPSTSPWGEGCFGAYLGDDREAWAPYDAKRLLEAGTTRDLKILIDQGTGDEFYDKHLQLDPFLKAAEAAGQKVRARKQDGYDHSYYFIASFMDDHIAHHAAALKQ